MRTGLSYPSHVGINRHTRIRTCFSEFQTRACDAKVSKLDKDTVNSRHLIFRMILNSIVLTLRRTMVHGTRARAASSIINLATASSLLASTPHSIPSIASGFFAVKMSFQNVVLVPDLLVLWLYCISGIFEPILILDVNIPQLNGLRSSSLII